MNLFFQIAKRKIERGTSFKREKCTGKNGEENSQKKAAAYLSWKTEKAINAVATYSKLLRSEAFAAEVIPSPNIRQTGAAISRIIIPRT